MAGRTVRAMLKQIVNKTKMNKNKNWAIALVLLGIALAGWFFLKQEPISNESMKIGILTDLSGGGAYWGESTKIGIDLAVKELAAENIMVTPIYEDYKFNPTVAAAAAQKLVNVDKVQGLYAELNPAAVAAGSVVKDKDVLFLYDAAIESPLASSPTTFKTYLDFKKGCAEMAAQFKNQGITNVGVLQTKLEFSELCSEGIKSVLGPNVAIETYNVGDQDVRTQILKLKSKNVKAVINAGFEGDVISTLSAMQKSNLKVPFGTVTDSMTDKVIAAYPAETKGSISFGFKDVDQKLIDRLVASNNGKVLGNNYAAALGYFHMKQLARSLSACRGNVQCAGVKLAASPQDDSVGFQKYVNRIANLDILVKQR